MQHTQKTPALSQHYTSILKSCIAQKSINPGKQIHAQITLNPILSHNINLATKLVYLYCICKNLTYAHQLFDKIPKRNIFLWNILIRGYAFNGPYEAAISLYNKIPDHGLVPDKFTFPSVLKACSNLSSIKIGRDVHDHVRRIGLESDVFVGSALIDMYAKCGCVVDCRRVFDGIGSKDVVLWNSMLSGYAQNGYPEECLKLCFEMVSRDFKLTEASLVTAISASADSAAISLGRGLHAYSWRFGFVSNDRVKTALLDMYAKIGNLRVARVLFEDLNEKRLVSWNAIITGYAMHGYADEALDLFRELSEKSRPDHVTFVGVLSACKNRGLLEKGQSYFDSMIRDFCIEPSVEHYTCIVDLLGRYNRLNEARDVITKMRVVPDSGIWGALLNACKIHGNVELAELALEKLIELKPGDAGNYVILSNIYAQAGKWERVAHLRKAMNKMKIKKTVACSWVEVKTKIHGFVCGDTSHPMWNKIYEELREIEGLIVKAGYVPNVSSVFYDVESDEKSEMVSSHSERLAIAFGMNSTPPRTKIVIMKNLRVCEDCHVAIKLISKVKEREIIVRDVNRYHNFKDGLCSCGDYW